MGEFRVSKEQDAQCSATEEEVVKHLMDRCQGVNGSAVDGEKPSAAESGMPTRDAGTRCGWSHGGKDQLVVLLEKDHTISTVVGEIKFAKVQFLLKCFVVGSWRQINLCYVSCGDTI
jgi:hypothetical protein